MQNIATSAAGTFDSEERLISHIRLQAQLFTNAQGVPEGWIYPHQFHLLLQMGRRLTPSPTPDGLASSPHASCWENAAH